MNKLICVNLYPQAHKEHAKRKVAEKQRHKQVWVSINDIYLFLYLGLQ